MLAIAAVLAPLFVMNGLRAGVIGEIFERLRADPAMRRITLDATGATRLDAKWFDTMTERGTWRSCFPLPALPPRRSISPRSTMRRYRRLGCGWCRPARATRSSPAGSPALDPYGEVKVASAVADRARLATGSEIFVDVERRRGDRPAEAAGVRVTVVDVALPERHGGTVVFAHPKLLGSIEAFRDGFSAPEIGTPTARPREERTFYPNFRLYAQTIEDVSGIAAHLRKGQGLSVSAQEGPIASAIQLDRNVRAVLDAIMLLGAAGLAGSLCAISGQWRFETAGSWR